MAISAPMKPYLIRIFRALKIVPSKFFAIAWIIAEFIPARVVMDSRVAIEIMYWYVPYISFGKKLANVIARIKDEIVVTTWRIVNQTPPLIK